MIEITQEFTLREKSPYADQNNSESRNFLPNVFSQIVRDISEMSIYFSNIISNDLPLMMNVGWITR